MTTKLLANQLNNMPFTSTFFLREFGAFGMYRNGYIVIYRCTKIIYIHIHNIFTNKRY